MKNIYVTTDLLEISTNAMKYAAELAKQTGATLTVIHAYHFLPPDSDTFLSMRAEQFAELRKRTETEIMEWCDNESLRQAFKYKVITQEGLTKDVIVELVNRDKPDLLIMGSRKSSMLDKIVFGTISGKVIREINTPLLVIPEGYDFRTFSKIVYASDIHDSDIDNLNSVVEFATPGQAQITVLHVTNFNEEDSKYDVQYFADLQNEISNKVNYSKIKFELIHAVNLVKVLNKYTELTDANLLVMEQTKKNWFERLFNPSATQKEFYTMSIPTLFFKPEE